MSFPDFTQLSVALPTSVSDFVSLRSQNNIYVDKTEYVYLLAADSKPRVLTRPRRFGKSTLISTLKELFLHGVEPYDGHDSYFKGLAIESKWNDPDQYLVLNLDFYRLNLRCSSRQFEQKLNAALRRFMQEQGLLPERADFSVNF